MRLKELIKQVGGTTSDLFNLPLAFLDPNPDNIRLDTRELRDHIRSIADSIKETGYLRSRPLTVRLVGERAIVVDGNCRFAACRLAIEEGAELLTVPCVPEAVGTTTAERLANMLVSNAGLQHSPIEKVAAIKLLLSYGWTDAQIAKRLGVSRQTVANLLDLAAAPDDVQAAVANGTVSATQAIRLIRSEGEGAGRVIAEAVETTGRQRVTAKAFKAAENKAATETPPDLLTVLRKIAKLSACWSDGSAHELHVSALEAIDWEVQALLAATSGEARL